MVTVFIYFRHNKIYIIQFNRKVTCPFLHQYAIKYCSVNPTASSNNKYYMEIIIN